MAIRKQEIERARQRVIRPMVSLIDNPSFRQCIKADRAEIGIYPGRRQAIDVNKELAEARRQLMEKKDHIIAKLVCKIRESLPQEPPQQPGVPRFGRITDPTPLERALRDQLNKLTQEDTLTLFRALTLEGAANLKEKAPKMDFPSNSYFPESLRDNLIQANLFYDGLSSKERCGLSLWFASSAFYGDLDEKEYFWCLCFDFEGKEHDDLIELALIHRSKLKMYFWYDVLEPAIPWELHKAEMASKIKPNHIYLDVTNVTLDDIVAYWGDIAVLQSRLGVKPPTRGRPKGSRETHEDILSKYYQLPKYKEDRINRISRDYNLSPDTVKGILNKNKKMNTLFKN